MNNPRVALMEMSYKKSYNDFVDVKKISFWKLEQTHYWSRLKKNVIFILNCRYLAAVPLDLFQRFRFSWLQKDKKSPF